MTLTAFEAATAIQTQAPGVFTAQCSTDWFTPRGPHGGYLAAIVVRAVTATVADPARVARSLTLHYLRPPAEGEVEVEVQIERTGRSLTSLTVRLTQGGKLCVVGIAACSSAFPSIVDYESPAPDVPPADGIEPVALHPGQPPMARQFAIRPAIGPGMRAGRDEVKTGGWMALRDPPAVDAALIALYTDAWLPVPFLRTQNFVGAPTVDLTIHFRVSDLAAHLARDESVLGIFTSRTSADGFFDEEGELWSPDGVLLAQSRQLGLLVAM